VLNETQSTETRSTELAGLRERSDLLAEVLGSVPVLVMRIDADGRVLSAEGEALRHWGLAPQTLLGANLLEKYGPEIELGADIRRALAGQRCNGVIHYPGDVEVEYHLVPRRDENGDLAGCHGLALDVTDSRRRQRAERENAAKSRFLAAMSHELRTPLNSILGFNQLLASQAFGSLTERQSRYVDNIRTSGTHLLGVLTDVLDLAKVSSGAMEIQTAPVAVRLVCGQAVETARSLAMARGVDLDLRTCPSHVAMADERRLTQAVLNLVANAIKFTPAGGTVRVSSEADGGTVSISVSDTGIGIPADRQDEIFEEFSQLPEGAAEGGTGLGLALTRQLVLAMGGRVELASAVGQGSTFTLRLQAA
jgi:signal transduction histidine kinase